MIKFGTDAQGLMDEYNDDTFWSEATDRSGERDFTRKYTEEEIVNMAPDERFMKIMEY